MPLVSKARQTPPLAARRFARGLLTATAILTCVAGPSVAGPALTLNDVKAMEAHIVMPSGTEPLANYDRYYALDAWTGEAVVVALFSRSEPKAGAIHIVSLGKLPRVYDGWCGFVDAKFDLKSKQTLSICCHNKPCPPGPAIKPRSPQ